MRGAHPAVQYSSTRGSNLINMLKEMQLKFVIFKGREIEFHTYYQQLKTRAKSCLRPTVCGTLHVAQRRERRHHWLELQVALPLAVPATREQLTSCVCMGVLADSRRAPSATPIVSS